MIDAGGCIYDDDSWALAVLKAARQLTPGDGVDETEFWSVYDAQRQAQGGSLSRTVATRFLPSGDPEELNKLARSHYQVPAASMYPDARPTLAPPSKPAYTPSGCCAARPRPRPPSNSSPSPTPS
jgi:hypothetical protein